jgi:hypothetical protein
LSSGSLFERRILEHPELNIPAASNSREGRLLAAGVSKHHDECPGGLRFP